MQLLEIAEFEKKRGGVEGEKIVDLVKQEYTHLY